jgi:hypothetical protein
LLAAAVSPLPPAQIPPVSAQAMTSAKTGIFFLSFLLFPFYLS